MLTFLHFHCIVSNLKHGNQICPVCRAKWKEIPFQGISLLVPLLKPHFNASLPPGVDTIWFEYKGLPLKWTKLKQIDCDFLKRWCEKLAEENRRLKKELQQLKDLKFSSPFCIQRLAVVAATLTVCPSCDNIGGALDEENAAKRYAFFINPLAAC